MAASYPDITILPEPINSAAARVLLDAAEAELHLRYPEDSCHAVDLSGEDVAFYVVWIENQAVACGALRPFAPGTVEIKRMFVSDAARGKGIGRRLLRHLVVEASALGYGTLILETGTRQPEAIALYKSEGFFSIPCGTMYDHPLSLCFQKNLMESVQAD